jgi:hypothetical protein
MWVPRYPPPSQFSNFANSTPPIYDGALGEQHLRDFQDNEKTVPTVLTTSQKLSTGVDARNVRNIVLMRPVNSMIEFKQIIGRGTRLYDGKDYSTIYDFVKAYHHFSDPEWAGEPMEPAPASQPPPDVPPEPRDPRPEPGPRPLRIKVQLADGKARTIQHMMRLASGTQTERPARIPRFRPRAVRESRGGRTGSRQTAAPASPEVSRHQRRGRRLGQTRGNRNPFFRISKVPIRAKCLSGRDVSIQLAVTQLPVFSFRIRVHPC